ncbi:MAG: helix-turn-helix domain-containing protein [Lachnospiraceae bacterium]
MKKYVIPDCITAIEIKTVRKKLKLTQKEFAGLICCSKSTVERWETSSEPITGPIVLLLHLLERQPEIINTLSVPEKIHPLRLWYMHNQNVCTIIDVDEVGRHIKIYNYTDNVMFRAFGKEENPDYMMFEEFIESRCFPKSRDKMKLILKDLDLPFYDPFMIIEKTQGRMAEDDFWIRIER